MKNKIVKVKKLKSVDVADEPIGFRFIVASQIKKRDAATIKTKTDYRKISETEAEVISQYEYI